MAVAPLFAQRRSTSGNELLIHKCDVALDRQEGDELMLQLSLRRTASPVTGCKHWSEATQR